jgi:hypothetical protein
VHKGTAIFSVAVSFFFAQNKNKKGGLYEKERKGGAQGIYSYRGTDGKDNQRDSVPFSWYKESLSDTDMWIY